ncbi:MAG TPA: addiction module toxin, HicA family [Dehalococcoidia bacterium]|nr:addiction module toxin, HicA family [Dehalococcoidia bacterium]
MTRLVPVHWKRFECVLLKSGCWFDREEGDHRIYKRDSLKRPLVIPRASDLPVFIIRNNLKTLGISRDEYLTLLQDC